MYDVRLRLSNQVVEEVKKHFGKMAFRTIIQRNIKLSEAPSYGKILYHMMPQVEVQKDICLLLMN